ncbi:MAG: hypothetical protein JWP06_254 [Candidatus Saccharibacteria bacterium]|nr:hypothetical protein [Candidatus Saccharibacteria bacterium]
MEVVKSNETVRYQNSESCVVIEYEMHDEKDINGAVIELTGRYPESGFVTNDVSKELVYVINGTGKLVCSNTETTLQARDMILIQPGEIYYFEGKLSMLISSSPAWYPEQHRNV